MVKMKAWQTQNKLLKSRILHDNRTILVIVFICVSCLFLAACTPESSLDPPSTTTRIATNVPTSTPLPTWTPTPIPTPTPVPPAKANLKWPYSVNALTSVPVEVDFIPPPGVVAQAKIEVRVMDPASETYAVFHLNNHDGSRYYADEKLQLPLNPLGGYWWAVADVESNVDVEGERVRFFIPEQIYFRPLQDLIPGSVNLRVPINFLESASQGDLYAGSRIWQHKDGQIGLWWAPGPTESLLLSNAVTMLEATFPESGPPVITDVVETEWHGRITFVANLIWADAQPGMAWVVQDRDFWLYVLDIRALDGGNIPRLIEEVASTFSFTE